MLERSLLDDAMRRALMLARRGPAANQNPQVGCVILDPEGRIIAEGWHQGAGTLHAETDALSRVSGTWRQRADELTAVVTLEPCNHFGNTGPCATALIEFGIGAVAYAQGDLGPESGGGADALRAAGVEVLGGVCEKEVRALMEPWIAARQSGGGRTSGTGAPNAAAAANPATATDTAAADAPGNISLRDRLAGTGPVLPGRPRPRRPRIIVKWAQSLDGRAAAANGTSQWITGPEARADAHRRRATADAILTGTGTLLADDPSLTARTESGGLLVPPNQQPIPVVLGQREIPADARIRRHPALAEHGLDAPIHLPGADLEAELSTLARYRIYSVFVEAGPRLVNTLIAQGLADELLVYVAPALLGGPKVSIGHLGIDDISDIRRLEVLETVPLGPDLLLRAEWSNGPRFPGPIANTLRAATKEVH